MISQQYQCGRWGDRQYGTDSCRPKAANAAGRQPGEPLKARSLAVLRPTYPPSSADWSGRFARLPWGRRLRSTFWQ